MSKLDKFKSILEAASAVSKPFVPGSVGSILDAVNKGLADKKDQGNEAAIKALAEDNEAQTAAILALHARLQKLESK
jgi:hypothetical protein